MRLAAALLVIAAFFVAILGIIWWALSNNSEWAQACEDRGGHVYNRTVGKMHYYKCVTDDDRVIRL